MVTRNVVLTETQDQLVQALVASGRYQNVSEAMRAGLRLLEQEEAQLSGIRQGLFEGLAQANAGSSPKAAVTTRSDAPFDKRAQLHEPSPSADAPR